MKLLAKNTRVFIRKFKDVLIGKHFHEIIVIVGGLVHDKSFIDLGGCKMVGIDGWGAVVLVVFGLLFVVEKRLFFYYFSAGDEPIGIYLLRVLF